MSMIVAVGSASAAAAQAHRCPKWEPGTRYPWQSNAIVRGDLYAWLELDVNRGGYPFRCRVRRNNYPDPESRVWLCKQYYESWRAPRAAPSDPDVRTLTRFSLVPGYRHDMADRRARPQWFAAHPGERPECYPEPTRPDRMDL